MCSFLNCFYSGITFVLCYFYFIYLRLTFGIKILFIVWHCNLAKKVGNAGDGQYVPGYCLEKITVGLITLAVSFIIQNSIFTIVHAT